MREQAGRSASARTRFGLVPTLCVGTHPLAAPRPILVSLRAPPSDAARRPEPHLRRSVGARTGGEECGREDTFRSRSYAPRGNVPLAAPRPISLGEAGETAERFSTASKTDSVEKGERRLQGQELRDERK